MGLTELVFRASGRGLRLRTSPMTTAAYDGWGDWQVAEWLFFISFWRLAPTTASASTMSRHRFKTLWRQPRCRRGRCSTALAINEYEERLLTDICAYLRKLAPPGDRYRHNDLHLRDVPPDEPENAHSHLMAMTLSTSEVVPIVAGKLALGTYQSVLFLELDGPRQRSLFVQVTGEVISPSP
jgi:secondary thiamine-phosphate synthase enzyme